MPSPIATALQSTCPVEKVNFKNSSVPRNKRGEEQNREEGERRRPPKKRPKSLQHLTFENEKIKHSTLVKELTWQAVS